MHTLSEIRNDCELLSYSTNPCPLHFDFVSFSVHLPLQYAVHEIHIALEFKNENTESLKLSNYFHGVQITADTVWEIFTKRKSEK